MACQLSAVAASLPSMMFPLTYQRAGPHDVAPLRAWLAMTNTELAGDSGPGL